MGEYDITSVTDGKHEDFDLEKKIVHEQWSLFHMINDIAILKLVRDATFNGNLISNERLVHAFIKQHD